jgi:hypothetical protein
MEHHPLRNTAIGIGLAATVASGAILRPDQHLMSADDYFFREQVLSSRPFTPQAVRYLETVPLFNRHVTHEGGGGYYKDEFPYPKFVEVFSNQEEAAVHEMSHAFFDYLTSQDPDFATNFMNAESQMVEQDKEYGFFKTLAYGFGDKWKGIDRSDATEWYASTASEFMGKELSEFPEPLKEYYKYEFIIPHHLDRSFPAKTTTLYPPTPNPVINSDQQ